MIGDMKVSDVERRAAKLAREGKLPKSFLIGDEDLPAAPPLLAHLLLWYFDLRAANPRGWRFEPLTYSEIEAFGRVCRLDIKPYEAVELKVLDSLWMSVQPKPEDKSTRR